VGRQSHRCCILGVGKQLCLVSVLAKVNLRLLEVAESCLPDPINGNTVACPCDGFAALTLVMCLCAAVAALFKCAGDRLDLFGEVVDERSPRSLPGSLCDCAALISRP
jgi:hypothetical protein